MKTLTVGFDTQEENISLCEGDTPILVASKAWIDHKLATSELDYYYLTEFPAGPYTVEVIIRKA